MRELYKGIPDREILHAFNFAQNHLIVATNLDEEHIASRLNHSDIATPSIGDALASLCKVVGQNKKATDCVRYERKELKPKDYVPSLFSAV